MQQGCPSAQTQCTREFHSKEKVLARNRIENLSAPTIFHVENAPVSFALAEGSVVQQFERLKARRSPSDWDDPSTLASWQDGLLGRQLWTSRSYRSKQSIEKPRDTNKLRQDPLSLSWHLTQFYRRFRNTRLRISSQGDTTEDFRVKGTPIRSFLLHSMRTMA